MTNNWTQIEDQDSDIWQFANPPKYLPYEFEKSVDMNWMKVWSEERLAFSGGLCFLYFIFVQVGPSFMKNRKPFDLQRSLIIWNFLLAIFSIITTVRTAPSFFDILSQPNGYYDSICVRKGLTQPGVFWCFAFAISKFFEFGDTIFIVLRKKPLMLLHWFHHLTMAFICMIALAQQEPVSFWVIVINSTIHSIMYTYYAIRAMNIKLLKEISMLITTLQITQFIIMFIITAYTVKVFGSGGKCVRSWNSMMSQVSIGSIYLFLFVRYFYTTYICKPKIKSL